VKSFDSVNVSDMKH